MKGTLFFFYYRGGRDKFGPYLPLLPPRTTNQLSHLLQLFSSLSYNKHLREEAYNDQPLAG